MSQADLCRPVEVVKLSILVSTGIFVEIASMEFFPFTDSDEIDLNFSI